MSQYKSEPLSVNKIKRIAKAVRSLLEIEKYEKLDPIRILELSPYIFDELNYEIVDDNELMTNVHGDYNPQTKTIRIKNSVYDGAYDGNGRDRMTIMHELSHHILLSLIGYNFQRAYTDENIKPYEDPEWQAKCLAGELMAPSDELDNMNVNEIIEHYGVSYSAALKQKRRNLTK